jgi:hypothetical protein
VRPVSADVCQQKEKDFRATIRGNTGGAAAAQKIQTEEEIRRGHPLVWMVGVWNWSPFYTQTDQFTKRGSGQTSKKRNKMGCVFVFCRCGRSLLELHRRIVLWATPTATLGERTALSVRFK